MNSRSLDTQALDAINELAAGDQNFLAEIINCFVEDTPKLLNEIRLAIADLNPDALQQASHSLKASSASLGATTMAQICQELEAMGKAGTVTVYLDCASQLEAEFAQVKVALEAVLTSRT